MTTTAYWTQGDGDDAPTNPQTANKGTLSVQPDNPLAQLNGIAVERIGNTARLLEDSTSGMFRKGGTINLEANGIAFVPKPQTAVVQATAEDVLKVLESVKDHLLGDTLADIGYYDVEPQIVQAVNSFDALRDALRLAQVALRAIRTCDHCAECAYCNSHTVALTEINAIDAALALADKGPSQ